jgi:peroxiredoxin
MSSTTCQSSVPDHMLGDRIAAFQAQLTSNAPDLAKAIDGEIERLVHAGVGAQAPRAGDPAPTFTLPDARGGEVSLRRLLVDGPVVLVFYRGQWCPYCDLTLRAYQELLPRIHALGAELVAISPQIPDESLSTAEKKNLAFSVLSDVGNRVARRYGLVFQVPAGLDLLHKGFGVDLARSNGDASNELPVPGVFIVARDGRVAFGWSNADYRERLEPAVVLQRLEQLR